MMNSVINTTSNNINTNVITNTTPTTTPTPTTNTAITTTTTTIPNTGTRTTITTTTNIPNTTTAITAIADEFWDESNSWWRNENIRQQIDFYLCVAEIIGCTFEQFDSLIDFLIFSQQTISKYYYRMTPKDKSYLDRAFKIYESNQFYMRPIDTHVFMKVKILKRYDNDIKTLDLLVKASDNKLPTVIYSIILKEYVGLRFKKFGCECCQKENRPLDVINSHYSGECRYSPNKYCLCCRIELLGSSEFVKPCNVCPHCVHDNVHDNAHNNAHDDEHDDEHNDYFNPGDYQVDEHDDEYDDEYDEEYYNEYNGGYDDENDDLYNGEYDSDYDN